jgi:cell division protein FtsZ
VVTIPFKSEGKVRINYAIEGITELSNYVDSLLVINNEKLREIYGDQGVSTAFAKADDILTTAVKGIAEIITVAGYINVDFADVETVMKDSGVAIMGMGTASGEERARKAIESALSSPLLNSNDITGAKSILVNISSGAGSNELTMDELGEITDYMYETASDDALIIRGLSQDPNLGENISVTVIATGFPSNSILTPYKKPKPRKVELLTEENPVPAHVIPDKGDDSFSVHQKSSKLVISDLDEEPQGKLDFDLDNIGQVTELRGRRQQEDLEEKEDPNTTLQKVKHMQNFFKKEGLSNKIIKENIEAFEDVPAYVRRNMSLGPNEKDNDSKVSKFTLSSGEDNEPVLRENNAYLNDNVD